MEFPRLLLVLGGKARRTSGDSSCCDREGAVLLTLLEIILIATQHCLNHPRIHPQVNDVWFSYQRPTPPIPQPITARFWSFPLIVYISEGLPTTFLLCPCSVAFLTVTRFLLLASLLLFGKILWDFYDFMSYLVQLPHHLISLPLFFFFKWFIFIKSFQGIPLGAHKNNSLCMFIFHWFMWHVIKLCNYKSTYNRHKWAAVQLQLTWLSIQPCWWKWQS